MTKQSKSILFGYLKCPSLATIWTNILNSFWHKDEKIPLSSLSQMPVTDKSDKLDKGTYVGTAKDLDNAKVDKVSGKGLSTNDYTTADKNKVNNSIQKNPSGSQHQYIDPTGTSRPFPSNSHVTTIYIDKTIENSNAAVLNFKNKPFKTMADGNAALSGNETAIRFHFKSSGVHPGIELKQKDHFFDADTTASIDFTLVNTSSSAISQTNNPNFTPTYHFEGGRVSIVSNPDGTTANHAHTFTPKYATHPHQTNSYKVRISGHINVIDWKAALPTLTDGVNFNTALFATATTNLIINEFIISSQQPSTRLLMADSYSNITVRKVTQTVGSRTFFENYRNSSGVGSKWLIDHAAISSACTLIIGVKVSLKVVTGQGVLNCGAVVFDNCHVDTTIDMNFTNWGYGTGRITSEAEVRSHYNANLLKLENFEGCLSNLTMLSIRHSAGIELYGNNKIKVKGTKPLANFQHLTSRTDVVRVESGVTVVEHETASAAMFTNGTGKTIEEKGILLTNSTNLGLTVNKQNRANGVN